MALTVTHAKNVAIADDPKAAAAGEVLPSDWNAAHVVSGESFPPAGGNLTFYVATTGSDSNPGTQASPFRTIQHAVSVAVGFNYQGLYEVTINVADGTYNETVLVALGPLFASAPDVQPTIIIIGDETTPTNVKIAPNDGTGNSIFEAKSAQVRFSGFSLVGDDTAAGAGTGSYIRINEYSDAILGPMDFDMGTVAGNYEDVVSSRNHSRTIPKIGVNWTFHNTAPPLLFMFEASRYSEFSAGNANYIFNSAINLNTASVFYAELTGIHFFNNIPSVTSSTNITGGFPIQLINDSQMILGADPTTVTWPSGPFDPTKVASTATAIGNPVLDNSSNIDGLFYAREKSGLPATTDLYQGTWAFFKDTSGGGVYAAYNDAGTIKKVALT